MCSSLATISSVRPVLGPDEIKRVIFDFKRGRTLMMHSHSTAVESVQAHAHGMR